MQTSVNLNQILREHKNKEGVSFYEHLIALFEHLVKEKADTEFYDKIENISSFVKKNRFNYKSPKFDHEVNQTIHIATELTNWENECLELLGRSNFTVNNIQKLGAVSNFFEDSRILEVAGIYFGEEESYILSKSLEKLAQKTKAKQLRFWGKILGTKADYYIAEGLVSNEYADEVPDKTYEAPGIGVNRVTYWVVNNVLDEWKELPLVSPAQIRASRQIKHYFTGDLNAKVTTYPPFNGLEKHYLKAQVVRITHSTELAPKGLYKLNEENEEDPELYFEEEFKYPAWEELVNPETWIHAHQIILKGGRITHQQPEVGPEEDPEEALQKLKDEDPTVDRLRDIGQDLFEPEKEDQGDEPAKAWISRTYGDTQIYNTVAKPGQEEGQTSYGVVAWKSTVWPGAFMISSAEKAVNVYVGYGHKKRDMPFLPIQPDDIWEDPEDQDEHPEPNPKDAPVEKPETDSDAPKNEDDPDADDQ